MSLVDAHAHVIPPAVFNALAAREIPSVSVVNASEVPTIRHRSGYEYPVPPRFCDVETLLADLDADGVDVGVLSIAPPLMDCAPASEAASWARFVNDELARFVGSAKGRLVALATLPQGSPAEAHDEMVRSRNDLGLVGAAIAPVVNGRWLDQEPSLAIVKLADDRRFPLLVHPTYVGPKPGLEEYYLTNLIGNPLETTICATRLILSGTLDQLKNLRILLVHGGGYLPYQAGRLDQAWRVRAELAAGCVVAPSTYLRRFWFDSLTFSPNSLGMLVEVVGADRVCYGSDRPFDMSDSSWARATEGLDLDAGQMQAVAEGTARGLFGFSPGDGR